MSLIPKITYGNLYASEIEFTYPAVEDNGDKLTAKMVESESLSGVKQSKLNYIEATREITYSFISEAIVSQLQTFYLNHAVKGKSFRYYDDKDLSDYTLYELDKFEFQKKKITSVGPSSFIYNVKLTLRRIIDSNGDLDMSETMSANILNNQASPISIADLEFSGATSGVAIYEIRRSTDSNEAYATGEIRVLNGSSGWELDQNYFGDDVGVTFSITVGAQVQYVSTNMSGTNYSGIIYFKEIRLNA